MDRDSPDGITAALAFAELMTAGGRAARAIGDGGLPAAVRRRPGGGAPAVAEDRS
jgi:hypothetical protein